MNRTEAIKDIRDRMAKVDVNEDNDSFFKGLLKIYKKDRTLSHIIILRYAQSLFTHSKYTEALKEIDIVLNEYTNYPFIYEYVRVQNLAGLLWDLKKNFYLSLEFFNKAEELALAHHCYNQLSIIYSNLGLHYINRSIFNSGMEYMEKCIKYAPYADKHYYHLFYLNLSEAYLKNKAYPEALKALTKCEELFNSSAFQGPGDQLLIDAAYLSIYSGEGDLDKEKIYLDKTIGELDKNEISDDFIDACETVISVLLFEKNYQAFSKIISRLKDFLVSNPDGDLEYFIYDSEAQMYESLGDYVKSNACLKKANQVLLSNTKYVAEDVDKLFSEKNKMQRLRLKNISSKKANQTLYIQSRTDFLTGLLNRHGYNQSIHELKKQLKDDDFFGVLFLDFDNFKNFNDKFGHLTGDKLLAKFGKILNLHENENVTFFRYGGDEFIGFVKGEDEVSLKKLALQIQKELGKASLEISSIKATLSVGIYLCVGFNQEVEEYLNKADEALYRSKGTKEKGRIEFVCKY